MSQAVSAETYMSARRAGSTLSTPFALLSVSLSLSLSLCLSLSLTHSLALSLSRALSLARTHARHRRTHQAPATWPRLEFFEVLL